MTRCCNVNANANANVDAMQRDAIMLMLKLKPALGFAALNSVGMMQAMHADMMRDATLQGKICDDRVYVVDAAM